jgi:hypothetical protein
MRILTDSEIAELIGEPKPLSSNWQTRLRLRPKANAQFEQRELDVQTSSGRRFRIVVKRSLLNLFDFSIILMFQDTDGSEYRLTRYNGRHSSRHTNKWEKTRGLPNSQFGPAFHIHIATERYQQASLKIDGYAEVTDMYNDYPNALEAFLSDCRFQREDPAQKRLI